MSESYRKHNSKSSRCKQDLKHRKKNEYGHNKKCEIRSETPPLPPKSIEELMKERESLKRELKTISEYSSKPVSGNPKKLKHSYSLIPGRNKKCDNKQNETKTIKQMSPEPCTYIDSEEEENIIELRRKQRKKLLEKFHETPIYEDHYQPQANTKKQKIVNEAQNTINNAQNIRTEKKVADMFSEDDFAPIHTKGNKDRDTDNNPQLTDNWDDHEGYYVIRSGDNIFNDRYSIKDVLGQGVFANVVRAQDKQSKAMVAIKIIRKNEMMYNTGLREIAILKKLNESDPLNKYHCVKYLTNFKHREHLCIVFEPLHMDLRSVLKKFAKEHGISMKALMSYSRQLLLALKLLKKIGIVHGDIKPDNILVNEKKNILKLCDFGSAAELDKNEPTPYLVSRFYRAPEIILGIPYNHAVDLWSSACSIYELATGKIMFTGRSNNKMLKSFMDLKGRIPSRLIKKGKFKERHFNYNNNFILHKKDDITGRESFVEVTNITITRNLHADLKKHCNNLCNGEEKKLSQLKDLLDKMLMIDSNQRPSITDCLVHPFIQDDIK